MLNDSESYPLVSVIVVSMNHEKYIAKCMNSIIDQDYDNMEIIYLDNNSSDDTYKIALSIIGNHSKLVHHVKQKVSVGICRNINEMLLIAQGEYVVFISADDFMLRDRIKKHVQVLNTIGVEYGVVFSDALIVDENGNYASQTFIERLKRNEKEFTKDIYAALLQGNFIPAMSAMVRTELIRSVGYYDESLIYEDYDMWLKLSRICKFFFEKEPIVAYRITPGSLEKTMGEKGLNDKINIYYFQLANRIKKEVILKMIGIYTNDLYELNYPSFKIYAKKYLAHKIDLKTIAFYVLEILNIKLYKKSIK